MKLTCLSPVRYPGNSQCIIVDTTRTKNTTNLNLICANLSKQHSRKISFYLYEFYFGNLNLFCVSILFIPHHSPHHRLPVLGQCSQFRVCVLGGVCVCTQGWLLCAHVSFCLSWCTVFQILFLSIVLYKLLLLMFSLELFTNRMQYSSILLDTKKGRQGSLLSIFAFLIFLKEK